ncbi:MAG: hypothetical protein KDJ73_08900 [Notoacmeibacter sp.]|nr:hypothetical protein [Notoacmeibacter sp.]MCC0031725.1 hypothetical protein [Brucellaceae bacterium]
MHPSRHNRTETLDFIQSMLGQLRTMAQAERCDLLAYLIEMAYVESSDIIRGVRPMRVDMELRAERRAIAG